MPFSSIMLIAIGCLSLCAIVLHIVIRQLQGPSKVQRRTRADASHEIIYADWLKPSRDRDLRSASA